MKKYVVRLKSFPRSLDYDYVFLEKNGNKYRVGHEEWITFFKSLKKAKLACRFFNERFAEKAAVYQYTPAVFKRIRSKKSSAG